MTPRLPLRVGVEAAPAYELILSLSVAGRAGRPRAPWLDEAMELAGADLVDEARALCGGCDMVWTHLLGVAYESALARRDLGAFVHELAALPPAELRLRLLGYYVRWFRRATPPTVIAAAAAGDARARTTVLETSYPEDADWQSGLRAILAVGPMEGKRRVVATVRRWRDRVFLPMLQERVMPVLDREARVRRGSVRRDGAAAVGSLLDGWEYVPEPGITHLLLVPSVAIAPTVHVLDHHQAKLVCYPVEPDRPPATAEPPASLVLLLRTLGDDRRLRILRLVERQELSATELAALLGVGLTTLVHHLDQLRDAGLVVAAGDRPARYRAAPDVEPALSSALVAYLRGR